MALKVYSPSSTHTLDKIALHCSITVFHTVLLFIRMLGKHIVYWTNDFIHSLQVNRVYDTFTLCTN